MYYLKGSSLHLGGIEVAFSSSVALRLQIFNESYRSFGRALSKGKEKGLLSVKLRCDSWPAPLKMKKLFDTQDSWAVYRRSDEYCFLLASARSKIPLWMARFHLPMRRIDLHCQSGTTGKDGARAIKLPFVYPLDQLLLMHYFARRQGMLTHSAGLAYKSKAYLFAGVSGAGKSTFSELLVKSKLGKVLSDERMIVRRFGRETFAFGTPWSGTAGIARNGSAPLAGIFFLKHGKNNRIAPLDPVAAADRILSMISIPWYDPDTAAPIIAFAKKVLAQVPAFEFSFTPDCAAIEFLQEFLKGESLQGKKLKGKGEK